jgi:hypothetical protein
MEKETKKDIRKEDIWRGALAVAIFGIIIFTVYSIESNIDATAKLGALAPQNYIHHPSLRRSVPPTPASIADWMTFDYLNHVFKMPPEYLKGALKITDVRYPRLTVRGFAAGNKINVALALTQVKVLVEDFLTAQK